MVSPIARLAGPFAALLLGVFIAAASLAQDDELQDASQLLKQGQTDRAMERVDGYLKTRPKDARGRFLKGLILAEQNKTADAIRVFTELTQEFPELPEPYNNLAVLYASQGQYDKARSALEMAIRTHPSYATAHENLGDIYAKMASQAYDKALSLDKGNTPLQTKLNLIRDLFSSSPRPPKAAAAIKSEPARVAAATPSPAPAPKKPEAAKPEVVAKAPEPAKPEVVAKAPSPAPPARPAPAKEAPKEPAKAARSPDEVVKAVRQWAKAWSDNDVPGYLGHYAPDFQPPKGESRSAWESERRTRIAKPRHIQVDVDAPKVTFTDAGRVTVTFRQHYRSDTLKVSSTKTLVMVKAGEKWLIQQERVGS
jgi:tetratricopeptide (TPR) repeat protein